MIRAIKHTRMTGRPEEKRRNAEYEAGQLAGRILENAKHMLTNKILFEIMEKLPSFPGTLPVTIDVELPSFESSLMDHAKVKVSVR